MKKYRYLPIEEIVVDGETIKVRRIQATRDIPLQNVHKGDLGGYVSAFYGKNNEKESLILSHDGSCWIGGHAVVIGDVIIREHALVTGNAIVRSNRTKGKAKVGLLWRTASGYVGGETVIKDSARVILKNYSTISGKSIIEGSSTYVSDKNNNKDDNYSQCHDVVIKDNAYVEDLRGKTDLNRCSFSGDVKVNFTGSILGAVLNSGEYNIFTQSIYDSILSSNSTIGTTRPSPLPKASESQALYQRLEKLETEYNTYRYDVVQLIRYPLMTDSSDPDIINLVHALKETRSIDPVEHLDDFRSSLKDAEKFFITAELKALTAMDTGLEVKAQQKLATAKKLLSVALDDSSNEHEKKISCERVLKEIRGILPLEDKLVENLRIAVGLKELEA